MSTSLPSRRRISGIAAAAITLMLAAAPALANPELITNGNFDSWTVNGAASTTSYIVTGGQTSTTGGATLTGWTNTGYSFVYSSASTVASVGAVIRDSYRLTLWAPDGTTSSTYSNNDFTASGAGGAFLAQDGAYQTGLLSQTVGGLTVGQTYALSFYWAAAQQSGYTGTNTEGWTVYWKDASGNTVTTVSTPTANNASTGFVPWTKVTYNFVATTTTMTVAFLATSAPGGNPPFSLLDGVSLQYIPEPGTVALLAAGLLGLVAVQARRRPRAA